MTATGDWGRLRAMWRTHGVDFELTGTTDLSAVAGGAAAPHALGRVLSDASVRFDLGRLTHLDATVFAEFYSRIGPNGSDVAGDVQGFSNIDVPAFTRVGEVWYEQRMAAGRWRIKAGRMDANRDVAAVEASADFLNSSMGYSPTIRAFPTYPNPRPGIVGAGEILAHLGVTLGAYRSADECEDLAAAPHMFVVGELTSRWIGPSGLSGRASAGLWRHTGHRRSAGRYPAAVAHSPYLTLEQIVWPGHDGRAAVAFAQYGATPGDTGIDRHVSTGLAWHGPFPGRGSDILGVAATRARVVTGDESPVRREAETSYSIFYKYEMTPWLAVQPDLQYIRQPGGHTDRAPAIVATFRMRIAL